MIRLQINDFKSWGNCMLELPVGKVILIKGSSGSGKTTIFQSIEWLLYGKIRNIEPFNMQSPNTRVALSIPYNINGKVTVLEIERKKNPKRLSISYDNNVFEDTIAQSTINNLFGSYELWLASCYIEQGCRNSFLTSPNSGKMELLNSIAFHEQDPSFYIDKIDASIGETNTWYTNKSTLFTHQLNASSEILKTDISRALSLEQVKAIREEIEKSLKDKTALEELRKERDINLGILHDTKLQLEKLNKINTVLPSVDSDLKNMNIQYNGPELNDAMLIENMIQKMMALIPVLQRRDDLKREMDRYKIVETHDEHEVNLEDYHDAISRETSYKNNRLIAQQYSIPYNTEAIQAKIDYYKSLLAAQNRIRLEQERDSRKIAIQNMEAEHGKNKEEIILYEIVPREIPVPDYSKYETESISERLMERGKEQGALSLHIKHLEKSIGVLECPNCKGAVRYKNGKLTLAEEGPVDIDQIELEKAKLIEIEREIAKMTKEIQTLKAEHAHVRMQYERAVMQEQNRVQVLKEKNRQAELAQQKQRLEAQNRAELIMKQKYDLAKIEEKIAELPEYKGSPTLLTVQQMEQINLVIGKLASVEVIELPHISSEQIKAQLNQQELKRKHKESTLAYECFKNTIPVEFQLSTLNSINTYIKALQKFYAEFKRVSEERDKISKLKDTLLNQIQTAQARLGCDPSDKINEISHSIAERQNMLQLSQQAHNALEVHNRLTQQRTEVVNLYTTMSDLEVLKEHAINTECVILQQVVDSINANINTICGTLFDRDINIELNLYKTAKTTGRVKPMVNFTISYQGGSFDAVKLMSGGESDRASLALTLALNRFTSFPLLMLDESLSSIDINMKDFALRAIRENTSNTVCIIMHDGIEGVFDHIINIDEYH